jgi:hypothetical protein
VIKYIEKCTGANHNGPAWIGRVRLSKSGRTVYFNGHAFKRARGGMGFGNHYDLETGDPYWISSVKRNGDDRHWAGSGTITVEAEAVAEYLELTAQSSLDPKRFTVSHEIEAPDPAKFLHIENDAEEYDRFRFPDLQEEG